MESICGAECRGCEFGENSGCKGCANSNGCPFGKECFIAKYIKTGGKESFETFKKQLIGEFNALNIEGMPEITELYALNGSYVNLAYPMPNGSEIKLLDDKEIYLGAQAECLFNDESNVKCFGLVANMNFLLVCEYSENGSSPEIVIFKKR